MPNRIFKPRLGNRRFPPEAACVAPRSGAGSRGEAPVPFLSPFLCGTTKKWHQSPHSERAQQCEPVGKVVKNPVFNTPINQNSPPTGFDARRFAASPPAKNKLYIPYICQKIINQSQYFVIFRKTFAQHIDRRGNIMYNRFTIT